MSPAGLRPGSGGADPCAAPVATRWTTHDYSLEESALAGAAVRVARNLAADLMGTGISFVLAGADGRELGRFAESAHELDTLDAAVPPTAGHWAGAGAIVNGPAGRVRSRRSDVCTTGGASTRLLRSGGRLKVRRPGWSCWSGPGMSPIHSWSRSPGSSPATSSSRWPTMRHAERNSSRRRSRRGAGVPAPCSSWDRTPSGRTPPPISPSAPSTRPPCGISRRRSCTAGAARRRSAAPEEQFRVTAEAIRDRGDLVGAVLSLATRRPASRPALGWESLTATERAVSELVASGHTNREVGRELLMSPHTVDAHLRHIFAKLDVNSRVDLARLVGETHAARSHNDEQVIVAVGRAHALSPRGAAPGAHLCPPLAAGRVPAAGGRSGALSPPDSEVAWRRGRPG